MKIITEQSPQGKIYYGDCTSIARKVFGNVVVSAKILVGSDCFDNAYEVAKEKADKIEESFERYKSFSPDENTVIVEFISGKTVRFSASEWASWCNQ